MSLAWNDRKPPTAQDIWAARQRIRPHVAPTPLITSKPLSELSGLDVHLKLEQINDIGAFKLRGATNRILTLPDELRARGLVTFSTGNHGQGVACAAQRLGTSAVVCVPRGIPQVKMARLERWNARVEAVGDTQEDAERHCYALAETEALTVISAFDDPFIIAGQVTAGLELMEALPDLDAVLVPVSGGGLLAGVALAVRSANPHAKIVGVSAALAPAMYESLKAGRPVLSPQGATLADSLRGGIGEDNRCTLPIIQALVDDMVLVSEEEIAEAMRTMIMEHQMIVEGAAAVGVAALMHRKSVHLKGKVAILITGCNVDMSTIMALMGAA